MKVPTLLFVSTLVAGASAQTSVTFPARPLGVTTLVLGADVANGIVAPAPGCRTRVPPLELLRLLVPEGWPTRSSGRRTTGPARARPTALT